ncbi:hypothetical protein RJ639_047244, partial [Escallonia herrerae]
MGFANSIGKYQLSRTIGEGTFAKVKLAVNTVNGQQVAIKMIDKQMIIENNLISQANISTFLDIWLTVQREIRTMKLLHHPNIVRIHEVIGTKTKIYIVMEYVAGGQLSDKMVSPLHQIEILNTVGQISNILSTPHPPLHTQQSYVTRLGENEARKYFQQLIDAVDYCHCRGVYHRDLKPQNLLLDSNGNLKVSDFGLSALRKPGTQLSTACGSPSYVAPELLANKGYDGAAADVWSCGVILFELLAGFLPFDDRNLINLYRKPVLHAKISKAEYKFPEWFTNGPKMLIYRILDRNSKMRMTTSEITEDQWFQINYEPAVPNECGEKINMDDINAAFDSINENETGKYIPQEPRFINAFQLIAMSHDLDLSRLFEEQASIHFQDNEKQKTTLGSKHTIDETIEKVKAAAKDLSLSVERMNNSKMKMLPKHKMTRCSRSCFDLSAEVIEVAPTHCVIEISKSAGELGLFKEFCKSLSSLLIEESDVLSEIQEPTEA